uniref:DNA-directed DNA polymerase n=1 Tax=Phylloscopus inornatus densovirus TaxID=2794547 RepID=A0A8A4XCR8_9VIRU|nr:MAG: PolB [Phylloscopus inornatus densovirus]
MATLLDAEAYPVFGYFYSREFSEVVTYLNNLLLRNESFRVTLHASALFASPDDPDVVQELHMAPTRPITMDPDMPDFDDVIQNLFDELTAPELYESIEGSGWTLLPDTYTFWVNTIAFQPNNSPSPNQRNTNTPPDLDDGDSLSSVNSFDAITDTLILSIAAHHVPKHRSDTRLKYLAKCQDWASQNLFRFANKVHMGTIASWHLQTNNYHLRVFSSYGNVIYEKNLNSGGQIDYIDLLWKNKKFSLITDLWGLFKEKNDRIFCDVCKKFHQTSTQCRASILPARSDKLSVPEMPQGRHALVIYADFESIIQDNKHLPSGCYAIAIEESGEVVWTLEVDATITDEIGEYFIKELVRFLTSWTCASSESTTSCKICGDVIEDESSVVGRNYINGQSGSYHINCWNDIKNTAFIYFHNFRGYDSHYLIRHLMRQCEVKLIRGKSFEKFDLISAIAGTCARMCFKDTFNFFSTSLANLVTTVTDWRYTPVDFRNAKGVFPYDWFDNYEKLNDKQLPEIANWFNKLLNKNTYSEEAHKIWEKYKMTSFKEYHNMYMKMDVLQLADVFEEFRRNSVEKFDYDPVYFQGAPSYTWYLCISDNHEKFGIITDKDVYLDIQKNIRGGISQVMHRYMNVDVEGGKILYLDINSLYSKCMEYKLPNKFIKKTEILPDNWAELYASDGDQCALMCVDLHYPVHLHNRDIAYPLAPHKFENRLCTTFEDKENYLCHAKALKYYLDKGLIIVKFHYMYVFNQDYILADYVMRNIVARRQTNNDILKATYKLLNNSLYGKTCENKFKYKKYSVKSHFYGIDGKRNPFMFKSRNWLEMEDRILSEDDMSKVELDKPIQIGFSVLEYAKLEIYKFLYDLEEVFSKLNIFTRILYTDTDSLIIWFDCQRPEQILYEHLKHYLDFDKVPPGWEDIRTPGTDKQSGLWSLETAKEIREFIGLRAKCYAIRFADNDTILKNKGIVKAAIDFTTRSPLSFESYRKALFDDEEIYIQQVLIRSKLHEISSVTQKKLALSSLDEKRQVLADKVSTLPWGYIAPHNE